VNLVVTWTLERIKFQWKKAGFVWMPGVDLEISEVFKIEVGDFNITEYNTGLKKLYSSLKTIYTKNMEKSPFSL
jgi:hypothetical protein